MNIAKQIAELEEKAAKYEHLKEQYLKYSEAIGKVIDQLEELRSQIDPYTSMKGRSINPEIKEIRSELYDKIQAGMHVSSSFVEQAYPDLDKKAVLNLMQALKRMPNIETRKEGVRLILFARKDV